MRRRTILPASWLVVVSCSLCSAAVAAPQVGWWWNPSESGRGFFVESQNGITFIGAYFYDADGHATWLVAGGSNADPYNYSGPLYNLSNGQTLFGGYVHPENLTVAGQMSVHFDDDTHGTFTWPGGVIQIQREIFGGGDAPFQPYSGWWWNSSESGSGYSLELQGNNLFVVGFMYDDTGRPTWYFTAGPMSSPTTYHGDVLQFGGGQTMGGPYQPPSSNAKVATVDIDFVTLNSATITLSGASSAAGLVRKSSRTDQITREFNDVAPYGFPTFYGGKLAEHIDFGGSVALDSGPYTYVGQLDFTGENVTWQLNRIDVPPPQVAGLHSAYYVLLGASFTLNEVGTSTLTTPLGTVSCRFSATGTGSVRYPFTANSSLTVDSRDPRHYDLTFIDVQQQIPLTFRQVCDRPGYTFPAPPMPLSLLGLTGTVTPVLDEISDDIPTMSGPIPGGSYSISGKYDFVGAEECDPQQNPICLPPGP